MITPHKRSHAHYGRFQTHFCLVVLACPWFTLLPLAGCAESSGMAQLEDRTPHGASPALLEKAERLLKDRIVLVAGYSYKWSSVPLFRVYTSGGKDGIFMEKNGDYVQLNSPSSLEAINEVLRERRLARADFGNAEAVFHYLSVIVGLREGPNRFVGSSTFLGVLGPEGIVAWSRGSKKKETALRELCRDPQFVFDGSSWVVSFNVFEADGRVEQWEVAGEFSATTQSSTVRSIARHLVKRRGTFSYEAWG